MDDNFSTLLLQALELRTGRLGGGVFTKAGTRSSRPRGAGWWRRGMKAWSRVAEAGAAGA